jgi:hypothetical protein
MSTNAELLHRFVDHRDQGAFAELVRQNLSIGQRRFDITF